MTPDRKSLSRQRRTDNSSPPTRISRSPHGLKIGMLALLTSLLFSACNLPLGSRSLREGLHTQERTPLAPAGTGDGPGDPASPIAPTQVEPDPTAGAILPAPPAGEFTYVVQSGDTLATITSRFNVTVESIQSAQPLPAQGFLAPGTVLVLPAAIAPSVRLLPDSALVFGPTSADFDVTTYLAYHNGFLNNYQEFMRSTGMTPAAQIIERVSIDSSVDPRLLLALLEYECGCVLGSQSGRLVDGYVLSVDVVSRRWLYGQLSWAADQLFRGYYGWRAGTLHEVLLPDFSTFFPAPDLNAGSLALYTYFTELWRAQTAPPPLGVTLPPRPAWDKARWETALHPQAGFLALYVQMFGDPWQSDFPLLPGSLQQPELTLPFVANQIWSLTNGPHTAWEKHGALGALDFSPVDPRLDVCQPSNFFATAVGAGPVVRSGFGLVVQDLDVQLGSLTIPADGREETGWVVVYLHMAKNSVPPVGAYLLPGDPVGRPSCEGGPATGAHLHIARKYNGEWLAADGPASFVMDGWMPQASDQPNSGALVRGNEIVLASPYGASGSLIRRSSPAMPAP